MLRSGAYADEIVLQFINRRFTPFWYDIAPPARNAGDGWAYDAKAVQHLSPIFEKDPTRGRGGGMLVGGKVQAGAYPAALFVTPEGEKFAPNVWGTPPPEVFLETLRSVVTQHPELFVPDAREIAILNRARDKPDSGAAQRDAARLHWELADWDSCLTAIDRGLEASEDPNIDAELLYLRGRVHACKHNADLAIEAFEEADVALKEVDESKLIDDIAVAQARVLMQQKKYREASEALADVIEIVPDGDRIGEATYYRGLCFWRLKAREKAKGIWREHRASMPWDRLARRSAASLGPPEAEAFLSQELIELKGWW